MLGATMRSPGLWLIALAAAAVLGYAYYTLLASDRPATATATAGPAAASADPEPRERASRRKRAPQGVKPAAVSEAGDARRRGGPPPRPEPAIPLPEAREKFADFMAELDRVKDEGRALTTPEWTDYYKRGHDALQPLLQHLDWTKPEEADELRKANEDLRTKLDVIGPGRPAIP